MNRSDLMVLVFFVILAAGFLYLYNNMSSFNCYMERSIGSMTSDIEYEFEPQGSLYGKTIIYRFIISSAKSNLEYFGMSVIDGSGEQIFFENRTAPEGGSIITTVNLKDENENITVNRFFKKVCYDEVRL